MSRRYRKRNSYGGRGGNPLALLILLVIGFVIDNWQAILGIALIAAAGYVGWYIYRMNHEKQSENPSDGADTYRNATTQTEQSAATEERTSSTYSSKASIMTDCEKVYFEAIKEIVEPKYRVQPQINLASVIDKETQGRYRNELFRNIDFGIFNQEYKLLLLVEINDETHQMSNRKERDQKVKAICAEAGIPLITFWTKYGLNKDYIRSRLAEYLILDINVEYR